MKTKIIFFLLLSKFGCASCKLEKRYLNHSSEITTCCQSIASFLKNYTRKTTILEISENTNNIICLTLANEFAQNIYIILLLKRASKSFIRDVKNHKCKNIILLEPKLLTCEDIETLARCEHFDVTIAHDFYEFFNNFWQQSIKEILNLADYTFILTNWENTPKYACFKNQKIKKTTKIKEGILVLCQSNKQQLDIARFTQRYKPRKLDSKYKIISTFDKKTFKKGETVTDWIPGINLMTFVLLRGIYPTDDIISSKIANFKNSKRYHNDLMIGNMVIQGHNIVPIDFDDKRRSASMTRCINRALNLFNGDNSRLKNPTLRIKQYYESSKNS